MVAQYLLCLPKLLFLKELHLRAGRRAAYPSKSLQEKELAFVLSSTTMRQVYGPKLLLIKELRAYCPDVHYSWLALSISVYYKREKIYYPFTPLRLYYQAKSVPNENVKNFFHLFWAAIIVPAEMSRENISYTTLCNVVPSATESAHVVPSSIPKGRGYFRRLRSGGSR